VQGLQEVVEQVLRRQCSSDGADSAGKLILEASRVVIGDDGGGPPTAMGGGSQHTIKNRQVSNNGFRKT
jgi:hypothetical protein